MSKRISPLQRAINIIWKGFEKQGWKKSVTSEVTTSCAYRGVNGTKCAIGMLIPNKFYNQEQEGVDVSHPKVRQMLPEWVKKIDSEILYELQGCHDHAHSSENIKKNLKKFCSEHDLEIPNE